MNATEQACFAGPQDTMWRPLKLQGKAAKTSRDEVLLEKRLDRDKAQAGYLRARMLSAFALCESPSSRWSYSRTRDGYQWPRKLTQLPFIDRAYR